MKLSELKTGPVVASAEGEAQASPPAPKKDEPTGVVEVTTPTGIQIYFQQGPKRLYRVLEPNINATWREVSSPSTILEVLEKGGLSWWGMKVGIEGVVRLIKEHGLVVNPDIELVNPAGFVDEVVEQLKTQKLTVNHVKGQAADRGTNVHTALESWVESGVLPDPKFFPDNEAGYVKGLVQFIKDTQPVPEHSELMVASTEYGYAGRFDLVAELTGTKYVSKVYPKNPSIVNTLQPGGRWLLDLKTSKDDYPSYHLQLAAYEHAMVESGYGQVDQRGLVRVTADGKYELAVGVALPEEFAAVMEVDRIIKRIEQARKAAKRK